jgi:hypothetical protein
MEQIAGINTAELFEEPVTQHFNTASPSSLNVLCYLRPCHRWMAEILKLRRIDRCLSISVPVFLPVNSVARPDRSESVLSCSDTHITDSSITATVQIVSLARPLLRGIDAPSQK